MTSPKDNKRKLALLLQFIFLVLSVAALMIIVDFKLVFAYIKAVPVFILILLVMVGLARVWLTGLRWRLLNPDTSNQLSLWHYFRFMMIAHAFNLIMPGALGGDFVKTAFTLKTVKHSRIDNVIAILVDRFVGLLSIIFLGTIAYFFLSHVPDRTRFNLFLIILYSLVIVFLFIVFNKRVHTFFQTCFLHLGRAGMALIKVLKTWQRSVNYFLANKHKVLLSFLLCLPIHIISFVSAYFLARSLNINISFFDISLVIAMVWVISSVPLTISGAGVRELSMIYFLSSYGITPDLATALSISLYIVTLLIGFFGLFFIFDFRQLAAIATKKSLLEKD